MSFDRALPRNFACPSEGLWSESDFGPRRGRRLLRLCFLAALHLLKVQTGTKTFYPYFYAEGFYRNLSFLAED